MLDRTRCPGCGQPTWLSHDKIYRRMWNATAERCFSCDAQESRQKAMGKEVHNPGAIHYRSRFTGW